MDALSSTSLLFLIVLTCFKIIIIFYLNGSNNKKKPPPSPASIPLLGHLHYLFKKPLYPTLSRLAARLGPAVLLRFGYRKVLVVSSFSLAQECFTKHDIVFASRPRLPTDRRLTYSHSTLGTAPYGAYWRNIRRIVTVQLLSSSRLDSTAGVRAAETHAQLRHLLGREKVELRSVLNEAVLNVMTRTVAGKRHERAEEAKRFEEMVEETFALSGMDNVRDFLAVLRVLDVQRVEKRVARLEKKWDEYLQDLIEVVRSNRAADRPENKTLIGAFLSLQEEEPDYYTDRVIKAQVLSMLSAGTDTSSSTIEWAMSLLLDNPKSLKKVQDEIDTIVGKNRLIQESDTANLTYLHSVVLETLRLYPSAPLLLPHYSSEDCIVGGYHIPRGTILLVNAYAIHRDPNVWEDPLEFKPKRFLGICRENITRPMLPFGLGRRRCPGEALGLRLVELVLGALVQCFEWERVGEEEADMEGVAGLDMRKAKPLELRYRPRQAMISVLTQL